MTRKLQPSPKRAIVGFIQCSHCAAVAYSAANEAQKKLLVKYHKILSGGYKVCRFTHVKVEYGSINFFQIKLTFSIWTRFHIHSFSPSHLMKFILAFGPRHFFFFLFHCQIPVSLSKQSDCQVSRCEEFPYRAPPPD